MLSGKTYVVRDDINLTQIRFIPPVCEFFKKMLSSLDLRIMSRTQMPLSLYRSAAQ